MLLIVVAIRIMGVKVLFHIVWNLLFWKLLVNTDDHFLLSFAYNVFDVRAFFLVVGVVILNDAIEETFDEVDFVGLFCFISTLILFELTDIDLVAVHHDGQKDICEEEKEHRSDGQEEDHAHLRSKHRGLI